MMKKVGLSIAAIGLLTMGCGVERDVNYDDRFSSVTSVDDAPEFNFDRNTPTSESEVDEPALDEPSDVLDDEREDPPGEYDESSSLWVRNGALFADAHGFTVGGEAHRIFSFGDAEYFSSDLTRSEEDSAMAIISFNNLDHEFFNDVGRTMHFAGGEMLEASEGSPAVALTVCAGPEDGDWEVDVPVEELDVTIDSNEEGDRVLIIESEMMNVEVEIAVRK